MASENNLTVQSQKYYFNTAQQQDLHIDHCDYCCHSRKSAIPLKSKSLQASPTQTPVATRKSSRSYNSINNIEEVLSYGSSDELLRHRLTKNLQANGLFKKKGYDSGDSENEDREHRRSFSGSGNGSPSSNRAVSPLMSRTDLDKFDFYIPKSPSLTKCNVNKDQQNLGNIDITQYLSQDEAQELQEIGVQVKLGEAKFCLAYDENNEKLRLILKCVDIFLKPSASVVGCNWACDTVTCFDVLQDKKKQIEVKFGEEISIDIKKNELNDKTLRLTIFDVRRRHKKIPIGHVLVNIRDLTELSSKLKIYTRKINFYSQPAGFNKGKINLALLWIASTQKLEMRLGEAHSLKSPHGVDGKEYYLKITVFIAGTKYKSYKSSIAKASPNLNFQEKFIVPLSSEQLKDTSFVFQLYMKHISKKMLSNKMLTGKTIIGPYMKHGERSFSQWEKVITKPMEEITETHILYL